MNVLEVCAAIATIAQSGGVLAQIIRLHRVGHAEGLSLTLIILATLDGRLGD